MMGGNHVLLVGPALLILQVDRNQRLFHNLIMENGLSTSWIENLALEELNMDESGVVHIEDHLNPVHLLEESSVDFMNKLRDRVEFYVSRFNEYRTDQSGHSQIKIFKISNTVNDFMLFRNSLRLIFSRKANDLLTVGFMASGKNFYTPRLNGPGEIEQSLHEIRAHVGPFNNISWKFQGEDFEIDSMVRHYLSEFIRNSAR